MIFTLLPASKFPALTAGTLNAVEPIVQLFKTNVTLIGMLGAPALANKFTSNNEPDSSITSSSFGFDAIRGT